MNDVKRLQLGIECIKKYCNNCRHRSICGAPKYQENPTTFFVKLSRRTITHITLVLISKETGKKVGSFTVTDLKLQKCWCSGFKEEIRTHEPC